MRGLCNSSSKKTLSGYIVRLTRHIEKRQITIVVTAATFNHALNWVFGLKNYGNLHILLHTFTNTFRVSGMLEIVEGKIRKKISRGACPPPTPYKIAPAALAIHVHNVETY